MVDIGGAITQGATISIVIKAIDQYSKAFKSANMAVSAMGMAFKAGAIAIGAASVALGAVGVSAVKTAASFETAFTGVRKTSDLTEQGFEELQNRFEELTKVTPVTFEQLSAIGEIAGQLGVEGVDNLEKFTKTIADISVTTNLTAEAAATSFARIANVMQIPLSEVDRMASSVVDLGNNFATTESEITNFAERIAGAGKIAGFTTDEILAIGAAMTSVGVEAEAGGTAVQKVLLAMQESVSTGGDKLDAFAETAGMTSAEFQTMWEQDASGAFARFVNGLGTAGDQAFGILDELGLKDQRLIRSFLSLANAGDLVNRTLTTSESAWSSNSALVEEATKRYDTFDSKMAMVKNQIRLVSEEIGVAFLPALVELAATFTEEVLPALEPLIPRLVEIFTTAAELASGALPMLTEGFIFLADIFLNQIIPAFQPVLDVIKELSQDPFFTGAITTAIEGMAPVVTILAEGFASLARAIVPLIEPAAELIQLFAELFVDVITQSAPIVVDLLLALSEIFKDIFARLKPLIPKIIEFASRLIDKIVPRLPKLVDIFFKLVDILFELFVAVEPLLEPLMDIAILLADLLIDAIEPLIPYLEDIGELFADLLVALIPIIPSIAELVGALVFLTVKILDELLPALSWLIDILDGPVVDAIVKNIETVINFVKWIGKAIDAIFIFDDLFGKSKKSAESAASGIDSYTRSLNNATSAQDDLIRRQQETIDLANQTSDAIRAEPIDLTRDAIERDDRSRNRNRNNNRSDPIVLNGPNQNDDPTRSPVIRLNDFILTKNGQIIETNPNDTIFGMQGGGANVTVNIDRIYGTDPEEMMEAFESKLRTLIRA